MTAAEVTAAEVTAAEVMHLPIAVEEMRLLTVAVDMRNVVVAEVVVAEVVVAELIRLLTAVEEMRLLTVAVEMRTVASSEGIRRLPTKAWNEWRDFGMAPAGQEDRIRFDDGFRIPFSPENENQHDWKLFWSFGNIP